ncbi:MAG: SoxR reducing system RseC family protein [Rhodocyclaceae bacterium]|nr:SoxR reducing system RseC family protein [Rhodocyclaceae bacterium]
MNEANVSTGVVTRIEGDYAWVDIGAGAGCGSCKSQGGCGSGLLGIKAPSRQHRLFNSIGARTGDAVTVSLPEGGVLKAALLAYLLPLALGIAGAAAGMWLGGSDGHALAGLFAGLGGGWLLLRQVMRRREPGSTILLQSQVIRLQPRFSEEP